ncbi:Ser/Thr protein phosphatase family protein [Spinellus fusiger]|nr:Ser/Thr protein phosphatase family protein [Spinellus fusiger]
MLIGQFLLLSTLASTALCHGGHSFKKREQPGVPKTPALDLEPLNWGDVNFIHTTDTHGWLEGHMLEENYNGDIGDFYSFVIRMKQKAHKVKKDLFIIDTGDLHDGNGLSDSTPLDGLDTQPLMKTIPYDILSVGNHELYVNKVTLDIQKNFVPHWKGRYLAANVYIKDANNNKTVQLGNKFTYFKGAYGTRVLSFGFLFDFTGNGNVSVVRKVEDEIKDPWFAQTLLTHKADVIVLIGHVGVRFDEFKAVIAAIRQHYPYIPITVLGGHTHIRDFAVYDSWAAGIESGRYMETIGFFSVNGIAATKKFTDKYGPNSKNLPAKLDFYRRYLDQNRATYIYHSLGGSKSASKKFDTTIGKQLTKSITKIRTRLGLSKVLGCVPNNFYISNVPPESNSSIYNLVTNEIVPKVVLSTTTFANAPYFIVNTGSQRFDIYKGPYTIDNMFQVSPFGNAFNYFTGVPASLAKTIVPTLNEGKVSKRSVWPHGYQYTYLRDQEFLDNEYSHQVSRRAAMTPGYTTKDDLGTNGDDTKHSAVPYIELPTYVSSTFPNATDTTLIDVVVLDFFTADVKAFLDSKTSKSWAPVQLNTNITLSTMWNVYAAKYWPKNC